MPARAILLLFPSFCSCFFCAPSYRPKKHGTYMATYSDNIFDEQHGGDFWGKVIGKLRGPGSTRTNASGQIPMSVRRVQRQLSSDSDDSMSRFVHAPQGNKGERRMMTPGLLALPSGRVAPYKASAAPFKASAATKAAFDRAAREDAQKGMAGLAGMRARQVTGYDAVEGTQVHRYESVTSRIDSEAWQRSPGSLTSPRRRAVQRSNTDHSRRDSVTSFQRSASAEPAPRGERRVRFAPGVASPGEKLAPPAPPRLAWGGAGKAAAAAPRRPVYTSTGTRERCRDGRTRTLYERLNKTGEPTGRLYMRIAVTDGDKKSYTYEAASKHLPRKRTV